MDTKNKPGNYDCLAKLAEDEPFFVLRAQDWFAPTLIRIWVELVRAQESTRLRDNAKIHRALQCALAMEQWPNRKVPD